MNKTAKYQFTIVVPVYNEEDSIYILEEKIGTFLLHSLLPACVLFVNDGSKDKSLKRIIEVCERNNNFFYLSLEKNSGLSAAIKAGIDATESIYVGYMDADLQTTPEDFNLLLQHIARYELVMGIRANRQDTFFKKLQSKIANGFRRMMIQDGIQDTGCPLKILHTNFAKRIPFFTGMHRFLPTLILLQEGKVKQVPVRHFPRVTGKSKYHLWNRLISPFIDCFVYRWMRNRYINYRITDTNITIQ
ncbi:glycosyltransferase [Bacteroides faecalis]|uniref:Dolichol-phosphate mannosyltransferase n=1 Tax=Bacteroides faecalis TaxID=2447885 RepID=A0A401LRY7_9BACE|nr:glycosyltransferase [Bacteroides faecalis]GCB34340.1 dolichol-phosphate mannosyltransferase [Bacteroides faecalis]